MIIMRVAHAPITAVVALPLKVERLSLTEAQQITVNELEEGFAIILCRGLPFIKIGPLASYGPN